MSRHLAALCVVTGCLVAVWVLGRVCDAGEALTRDLSDYAFRYLFNDRQDNQ